jgi:hypothetical protein
MTNRVQLDAELVHVGDSPIQTEAVTTGGGR